MSTPSKQTRASGSTTPAGRKDAGDAAGRNTPGMNKVSGGTPGASRPKAARGAGSNGTPVSARAAVKKNAGSSNATSASTSDSEAESRARSSAAMEELQTGLKASQETCAEYQKQIGQLQQRIKDSSDGMTALEETVQELHARIESLENDKREISKAKREVDSAYELEQATLLKFREESRVREEEMKETIQRLKDSNGRRESGEVGNGRLSLSRRASARGGRSPPLESGHFAPPSTVERSDSRSSSRLVHQKDRIIEGLRLELAEAQIKLIEVENNGGGQLQELERNLMESRMTNARLMEENESFQLLLSEKTLNGELAQSAILHRADVDATPTTAVKGTTLEDELRDADEKAAEPAKDLQSQVASLQEENKALTLYINSIISRLLKHDFDFMFDKNSDTPTKVPTNPALQKDLPPPPPPSDGGSDAPGILARTRSLMGGRKPRPQSIYSSGPSSRSTVHEDPQTAPSIPLARPNQRTISGDGRRQSGLDWNGATLVNNMYPGASPTRSTSGPVSPGLSSPRGSFITPRPAPKKRITSGSTFASTSESGTPERKLNRDSKIGSSRDSISSETSMSLSPGRSGITSVDRGNSVMVGSKMRPLRLVQDAKDEAAAKKAANRQSWMGWFNKGS